jgi:hypothetical protein
VRRKEPEQRALQASMIGIEASSPKSQKWHCQKKEFHLFEVDREFRNFTRSVGDVDRVTCLLTAPLLSTIPL